MNDTLLSNVIVLNYIVLSIVLLHGAATLGISGSASRVHRSLIQADQPPSPISHPSKLFSLGSQLLQFTRCVF